MGTIGPHHRVDAPQVKVWTSSGGTPSPLQTKTADMLEHFVIKRSVMVVFTDDLDNVEKHGTGTCIRLGGRYFVATAGHHFTDAPLPQCISIAPLLSPNGEDPMPVKGRHNWQVASPSVDIAWIELSDAECTTLRQDFVDITQLETSGREVLGERMYIYGFPGDPFDPLLQQARPDYRITSLSLDTVGKSASAVSSAYEPSVADIFAKYSARDVQGVRDRTYVASLPKVVKGLSGAGLWQFNDRDRFVWTPEAAKLVGIEHAWCAAEEWLRCTPIRHWLNLVAKDVPELGPTIESALEGRPGAEAMECNTTGGEGEARR